MKLAEIFKSAVKGVNFMTPYLDGYYVVANGVAELSHGVGFSGRPIYGVTVVEKDETGTYVKNNSKSQLRYSMREALDYIEQLNGITV